MLNSFDTYILSLDFKIAKSYSLLPHFYAKIEKDKTIQEMLDYFYSDKINERIIERVRFKRKWRYYLLNQNLYWFYAEPKSNLVVFDKYSSKQPISTLEYIPAILNKCKYENL